MHGWGRLTINLGDAERYGLITCLLENSIFSTVLSQVEGAVNSLIEGMLQGVFSGISNHDLGCLEVVSAAKKTPMENLFMITANERLSVFEDEVTSGMTLDELLLQLKG